MLPRRLALCSLLAGCLGVVSCARGERPSSDKLEYPSTGGAAGSNTGGSGGPATDGGAAVCGNGVREEGEDCDLGDLGGRTCMTEGFGSGGLVCSSMCVFDTTNCTSCGNGALDAEEECDGTDFGGLASCADINAGATTEPLLCTDQCTYDLSNCSGCGDGVIASPEDCEPGYGPNSKPDLGGKTCDQLGFDGGELDCSKSCRFDQDGCYTCGDATRNGIEQCDGADFAGKGCNDFQSATGDPYTSGSLACDSTCDIDTSNCMLCGDGVISGNEVCDSGELQGETCETRGFSGGTLQCGVGCKVYDTSMCSLCGNSSLEGSEQCDGANLAGQTCVTLGFVAGGSLSCSSSCTFDTSTCSNNTCGDGVVNGNDVCDCGSGGSSCTSAQLGGKTCQDFTSPANAPYAGGTLKCLSPSNCQADLSSCYYCGDAKKNSGEACDGADLDGKSCAALGFASGTLGCSSSCAFNTSACISVPNPLVICHDPGLPIVDNDLDGVTDTIDIPDAFTVKDVNVRLVATHAWVGDLFVELSHNGVNKALVDQPGVPPLIYGCSGDDVNATFDDEGSSPAESACETTSPAMTGVLTPNEPLSGFDGQNMSGAWSLYVADIAPGLAGTFVQWCIELTWE